MPKQKHYSPRISRFLVAVLYHEAQHRQIPMTTLVDDLLLQSLNGSKGWEMAQETRVAENPPQYRVK
jgi:hypothetical protein